MSKITTDYFKGPKFQFGMRNREIIFDPKRKYKIALNFPLFGQAKSDYPVKVFPFVQETKGPIDYPVGYRSREPLFQKQFRETGVRNWSFR